MTNQPTNLPAADYKILLEGSYSKVETPFVFVARDPETYALIRNMVEGLPASSTVDFGKNAVIAAFAGERSSGGWSVKIRRAADKVVVDVNAPPKGAMTAQVITAPFQIAVVPIDEAQAVSIDLAAWTSQIKTYRISKADFQSSGGIAGRAEKFGATGTIGVLTYGDRVTYIFNLTGKGSEAGRKISEVVSGAVNAGQIEIARIDAGTFAETPRPPIKAIGTATDQKISLKFDSHPPTTADGFMIEGKLEAVRAR